MKATSSAIKTNINVAACIDGQHRILWQSETAAEVLNAIDGLAIRNDRLIADDGGPAKTLFTNLLEFTKTGKGHAPFRSRRMPLHTSDGRQYVISIEHISAEEKENALLAFQGFVILIQEGAVKANTNDAKLGDISILSPMELDVAQYTASGLSVQEIADKKNVAPSTINTHKKRIYKKLAISNKQELATLYTEYRLRISTPEGSA